MPVRKLWNLRRERVWDVILSHSLCSGFRSAWWGTSHVAPFCCKVRFEEADHGPPAVSRSIAGLQRDEQARRLPQHAGGEERLLRPQTVHGWICCMCRHDRVVQRRWARFWRLILFENQETAAILKSHFEGAITTEKGAEVYEMMSATSEDIMMKYSGCSEDIYESMLGIDPECAEDLCKIRVIQETKCSWACCKHHFLSRWGDECSKREPRRSYAEEVLSRYTWIVLIK